MNTSPSTRPLRIAMLASNVIRIPPTPPDIYVPKGWSGAPELIVHHITEALVKRGHEVTLFASGDSQTSAHLISVTPEATWQTVGIGPHELYEHMLISESYQMARAQQFDIIHSHYDSRTAPYAPLVTTPTISTLHSPLDTDPNTQALLRHFAESQYYVSISQNQQRGLPELNYVATVYNGIEVDTIPFSNNKEDFLIFAGRVRPEKGVAEAIEVAKQAKSKLLIFGSADQTSEYWQKKIQPHLNDDQIRYMGMIPRTELFTYISRAKGFIFPLQWEEPFGLVAVETMATGTPTLTFSRGSMPEIVEHSKTGFLVNTLDEMIAAVAKLDTISPHDCRQEAEKRFSVDAMVSGYERAYEKILSSTSK